MRVPVFARRSNPSVDPPLVRKSLSYSEEQVSRGLAAWVDAADPRQGIICLELFQFAAPRPEFEPHPQAVLLPPVEVEGTKYQGPQKGPLYWGLLVRARMWAKAAELSA